MSAYKYRGYTITSMGRNRGYRVNNPTNGRLLNA